VTTFTVDTEAEAELVAAGDWYHAMPDRVSQHASEKPSNGPSPN
jgi:hypothetical protein